MPMPSQLDYRFTPQQKADVKAALKFALDTLNNLTVVQLTQEERNKANAVSDKRLPYVQQTFRSLAPNNPKLRPGYLSLPINTKNFGMVEDMREIMPLISELNERYTDYSIASQHLAYQYMLHFYKSCLRTPLGKAVCEALAPLFKRPKQASV